MLVGLAAKLLAEKTTSAVVAANFDKFITSLSLCSLMGIGSDQGLFEDRARKCLLYGSSISKRELLNRNYLGILVTKFLANMAEKF